MSAPNYLPAGFHDVCFNKFIVINIYISCNYNFFFVLNFPISRTTSGSICHQLVRMSNEPVRI